MGLASYMRFTVSWFLHLPARFPILGAVRFDFVLIIILFVLSVIGVKRQPKTEGVDWRPVKLIWVLIIYILVTIPLVYWPGSVVRTGIPEFVKAFVFFIFTMRFVRTTTHLKILLGVFLSCQLFRILEPLYLHVTEGYWGSRASMSGWQFMERLSGAPSDVINPNGLAFVCLTVIPFLYYYAVASKKMLVLFIPLTLPILYALALTGSRSGFIALTVIILAILAKSGKKIVLPGIFLLLFSIAFGQLSANFRDRYSSIFDDDARNASTFAGRLQGIKDDFRVAFHRPLFGHGLGTSEEANFNIRGGTRRSHNLYAEVAQELGFIGLVIFLLYILSLLRAVRSLNANPLPAGGFLASTNKGLEVWFYMNLVFSLASFGLSGYQWYLFGALILKALQLTLAQARQEAMVPATPALEPFAGAYQGDGYGAGILDAKRG